MVMPHNILIKMFIKLLLKSYKQSVTHIKPIWIQRVRFKLDIDSCKK